MTTVMEMSDQPKKFSGSFSTAYLIEMQTAVAVWSQERHGCVFDSKLALSHIESLLGRTNILAEIIRNGLNMDVIQPYPKPVNRPFKKDGTFQKSVLAWYPGNPEIVGGPFSRVEFMELKLTKRKALMGQLLRRGWIPTFFTKIGNPRLTNDDKEPCPNLRSILGFPGGSLSEYFTLMHRKSQLTGFLKLVRPDGRLAARAITIGTNTRRFRHQGLVNVPKAAPQVMFGREMREVFTVPPGYNMVGADAAGLELRILAHYMGDEEYIRQILEGDIHWYNVQMLGWVPMGAEMDPGNPAHVQHRDNAKTFIYAFLYGAGDAKIGSIVHGSGAVGKRLKARFLHSLPKLSRLIERVKAKAKTGTLRAIDGGPLRMRRDDRGKILVHKALNTLLQGSGSVVVKKATALAYGNMLEQQINAHMVIHMHDEFQWEVINDEVVVASDVLANSFRDAGEFFDLKIPLRGDVKVGSNWAETH